MPEHDEIGRHGLEIAQRVEERLALDEARVDVGEVQRVRGEAFFRELEGRRVRVDGSTKKLTTVLPRRVGTFLISRVAMSENPSRCRG
jgi:hypothetical protein